MVDRIGENYILKATMDEFDEYRMKKNMSDEMKYRENVYSALTTFFPFMVERAFNFGPSIFVS